MSRPFKGTKRIGILFLSIVLLGALVNCSVSNAQHLAFGRTWGGCEPSEVSDDFGEGVAMGPDGSIYLVGRTYTFGAGLQDAFVVKFSPGGELEWQRTWGGADNDVAYSVAVGENGSVYVVGWTSSFGQGNAFILRLNPANGDAVWQKTWGVTGTESAKGVAIGPDGSIYVAGSVSTFAEHTFILKLDPDGNLLAEKEWDGGWQQTVRGDCIAVASDHSVYVVGNTTPTLGDEAFILKLDPADLSKAWLKLWGGISEDVVTSVAAYEGGAVVGGMSFSFGQVGFVVKFDPDGNLDLETSLPLLDIGEVSDVGVRSDGRINAVCRRNGVGNVVTLADDGELLWHSSLYAAGIGDPNIDEVRIAVVEGNIHVAGHINFGSSWTLDSFILEDGVGLEVNAITGNVSEPDVNTHDFAAPPVFEDQSVTLGLPSGLVGPPVPPCPPSGHTEAFVVRILDRESGEVAVSPGVKVTGATANGLMAYNCTALSEPFYDPSDGLCHYPLTIFGDRVRLRGTNGADVFRIEDGLGIDMIWVLAKRGDDTVTIVDGPIWDHYLCLCGPGDDWYSFEDAYPDKDFVKTSRCEPAGFHHAPFSPISTRQILSYGVDEVWLRHYAGPDSSDESLALAVDDSGNVYVTGWSEDSGTFLDYATVKYDPEGVEQWVARYNGFGNSDDLATTVAVDDSFNIYVTGWSEGLATDFDYVTVKYDSTGSQLWEAYYDGLANGFEEVTGLVVDELGNVYVTGSSEGSGTLDDYATVKYNSGGVEQWVARYDGLGNGFDGATATALDHLGNVYVTGWSQGSGTGADYATVKYNSDGVEQWVCRYDSPENSDDFASAIAVDDSGNVYVTGWSLNLATGTDYTTVKYNSEGVEQWVASYNGPGNGFDQATAIVAEDPGYVCVTGWSEGLGADIDYATVRYNSEGVEQWVARYSGPGSGINQATSLAVDDSGNVFVTGWSLDADSSVDYATVGYSSEGIEQWLARTNVSESTFDNPVALALDSPGKVVVTGSSSANGWSVFTTAKYAVFLTGDASGDGEIDLADAIYLLNYLFKGHAPPEPLEAGDANCDGLVEIGDAIYLLNYLFKGGPEPSC